MSNNKQSSSIDWIINQVQDNMGDIPLDIQEIAKAMHKEEQEQLSAGWAKLREQTRETAMHIGFARGFESGVECYEDYYQELDETDLDEDEFTRNYIVDRFEEIYNEDNNEQQ